MDTYNITNAKYIIDIGDVPSIIKCKINGKELLVPLDPANTDYQAIQKWVAEGNTIEEAD